MSDNMSGYIMPSFKPRVIGPIPPRDEKGRMKIAPILGKRVKSNLLGEPVRDKDGQPVEETYDTRSQFEYHVYQPNLPLAEGATKGLTLFQVDYPPEPSLQVYARNDRHALEVYKKEWGINRFGERDPKVTQVN